MKRILFCACTGLLSALTFLPTLRAEVTEDEQGRPVIVSRDAAGRVCSRTVIEADGSRHVTTTEYWPASKVARRTVDEDRDPAGRATKRTVARFDDWGRVLERRSVTIDAAGKRRGTRTLYSYDAEGRAREATSPLGR
jgi:hypothetical protein